MTYPRSDFVRPAACAKWLEARGHSCSVYPDGTVLVEWSSNCIDPVSGEMMRNLFTLSANSQGLIYKPHIREFQG